MLSEVEDGLGTKLCVQVEIFSTQWTVERRKTDKSLFYREETPQSPELDLNTSSVLSKEGLLHLSDERVLHLCNEEITHLSNAVVT